MKFTIGLEEVRDAFADAIARDGFTVYKHTVAVTPPGLIVGFPGGDLVTLDGAVELEIPIIIALGADGNNQTMLDAQCLGPGSIMETLTGASLLDGRVSVGGASFDQHGLVQIPPSKQWFTAATLLFKATAMFG